MSKLAINGGPKKRTKLFPSQNTYDHEEMEAVQRVMNSGRLSWYRGNWGKEFYGGPEIRALEHEWQEKFRVRHAICCNSATSGLFITMGALSLEKRDRVIVTPYSMTCSATIPLAWGLNPIFADIEKDCFCLDYESVQKVIHCSNRTPKAIIAVSLFGQPFDPRLHEFGIPIIEDAAQALGSTFCPDPHFDYPQYAGTLGDIGIYSFNYGKHITCGEGGMIVTNDADLAFRCRLIMNHGESVMNDAFDQRVPPEYMHIKESEDWERDFDPKETVSESRRKAAHLNSIFGFNLRMTEIQAAIIRVQLRKLDRLLESRLANAEFLQKELSNIPAISVPPVREGCTHSYYVLPFLWDQKVADGLDRDTFINAIKAELTPREERDGEGVQIGCGYIKPIYKMPVFPPNEIHLPNVENLWKDELFLTLYHAPNSTRGDITDVAEAFHKVWENRSELRRA